MKLDWIPDFDINVQKGHIVAYTVITILIFVGGRKLYTMGHKDGWIDCLNQHQHLIDKAENNPMDIQNILRGDK